ncbi:MAG: hypothetical protein ACREDU_00890 [Methylocella sp.]
MQIPPLQQNTKSIARDDYDEDEYRSHEGCRSSIRRFGCDAGKILGRQLNKVATAAACKEVE